MANEIPIEQIPEDLLVLTPYGSFRVTVRRDDDGTLQITAKRQQLRQRKSRPIRLHRSRHGRPKRAPRTNQSHLRRLPQSTLKQSEIAPVYFRLVLDCLKWFEKPKEGAEDSNTQPIPPP